MKFTKFYFSSKEEIGRTHYFLGKISIVLFFIFTHFLLNGFSLYSRDSRMLAAIFGIFILILFTLGVVSGVTLISRRLHDMGYSGWWSILILSLPILMVGLLLVPGKDKDIDEKERLGER